MSYFSSSREAETWNTSNEAIEKIKQLKEILSKDIHLPNSKQHLMDSLFELQEWFEGISNNCRKNLR